MTDEIAHIDAYWRVDASSNVHIHPDDVEDTDLQDVVATGLACRHLAITEGACPCGAELARPNRADRRAWKKAGQVAWDGMVVHAERCPAVQPRTREWVQKHRRLARR